MQRQFDAVLTELLRAIHAPLPAGGNASGRGVEVLSESEKESGTPHSAEKYDDAVPVIVAVSGGVDSMVLAHLCLHSGLYLRSGSDPQSGHCFRFAVAHCNFHLRGEESDGDEALVRAWCAVNGIEIHVADFDTVSYAREHGLSIEMGARELRYNWFARLCRDTSSRAVLVAHNANDNAETLFLNLLRGTGLRGLCGMKPVSTLPVAAQPIVSEEEADDAGSTSSEIPLLRPLLSFTRDRILGYARANGIIWREDSTNGDSDYKRNRLRNEVFPLLAKINPSFIETLNREMRHFSSANAIVENSCPNLIREGRLNIQDLLGYEHWPYLLYILLEPYGFDGATVSSIEVLLRAAFLAGDLPAKGTTLSGKIFRAENYTLYTTSTELVITEKGAHHHSSQVIITQQGDYSVDSIGFNVEIIDREQLANLKAPKGKLYLDADAMPFPFAVRHWLHGDWINPFGMEGRRKKVSDLFVDLKYNAIDKANSLFLARSGEDTKHVYALLGERIDEAVKVTPATTKVLKITII